MLQAQAQQALSEVDLGEEFTDGTDGPALYLYYAQEGERIFDIAKRYHARAKDLAARQPLGDRRHRTPGPDHREHLPADSRRFVKEETP